MKKQLLSLLFVSSLCNLAYGMMVDTAPVDPEIEKAANILFSMSRSASASAAAAVYASSSASAYQNYDELLRNAARVGNFELVKQYAPLANINACDAAHGETALHLAASKGHYATVEYLVSQGANVQKTTNREMTPSRLADWNGHRKVAQFLQNIESKKLVEQVRALQAYR